ncbi:MAG: glutamine amidotransferase, partial [Candidatus Bathyarchaeota archaeon]|nr:glutamine amidotransferase [Candidatus Bathyarchaeota archaeon]
GTYGKGRAIAWTSDIGPHWCQREFAEWDGYKTIWRRMLSWVSDEKP